MFHILKDLVHRAEYERLVSHLTAIGSTAENNRGRDNLVWALVTIAEGGHEWTSARRIDHYS